MDLLVKRAQKGDAEAFIRLIEKHKISMYKAAKSYLKNEEDVADVMQDTVLSAFEHIRELKHTGYFKTWITRILINHCLDMLKQEKRCVPVEWTERESAEVQDKDRAFYELLEELSEDYRIIFLLYYGEGFYVREIADLLEMNENTVKSKLRRGRKKLEQVLCLKERSV